MTNIQFMPGAISAGECISNAWETLKSNYGMYLGIAIIAMIMTGCIPCVNVFIMGPVMGGVYFVVLRDMRGEPIDFGMMFKGFEKFVPLMVIGLFQSIPGVIAQMVQYGVRFSQLASGGNGDFTFFQISNRDFALSSGLMILFAVIFIGFMIFSFVWWAVFFFAIPLVMEHDMGAIDAIKLSARASLSNIGGLLSYFILMILVIFVGMLLLCIGMFLISMPVIYIGSAFAYRQVFPYIERTFNMTPPPPNAYGSRFGQGM
ncbi:MAG: hypothetical protein WBO10_09605 [Pyrinomonadaceae bacterium]